MKFKRMIALGIAMGLAVTSAMTIDTKAEENATDYSYQQMLDSVKAEHNYGLNEKVDNSSILQAWNWSYANITANLKTIAEQGFTTIQVSPPNELTMPTKDVSVAEQSDSMGWKLLYQPAGFQLNESTDNALGTKAEFVAMCEQAHALGIKVIVDVVIGHVGKGEDSSSTDPKRHVHSRVNEFESKLMSSNAFHSPWQICTYKSSYQYGNSDYDIEESMTQHAVSGNPDLATETQIVQDTIYEYLEEIILAGADGFCVDAPEHIETYYDTYYASDFFGDTLEEIERSFPDKECYAYGRILRGAVDGRPSYEYTDWMDVTDTDIFAEIMSAVVSGGNEGNAVPSMTTEKMTAENLVLYAENHVSYTEGETSFLTVQQRNKIWALTASRQSVTGMYFARPDDRTAEDKAAVAEICNDIMLGEARTTSWSNREVAAVNQFANYFKDAEENVYMQNSIAVVERGNAGAVLVQLGDGEQVSVTTTLRDGAYIDAITGGTFEVVAGELTGVIGTEEVAVLYRDVKEPSDPKEETGEIFAPEKVVLSNTKYTYDGKAKKPTVVVVDKNGEEIAAKYYTVSYKDNKNVGNATVTVTFKGTYEFAGQMAETFEIAPKGTELKSLTKGKKKITVKWNKQKKSITGYQIQYDTNKKFTKAKTTTVASGKQSVVLKKLKAKKKYYVRIRTYKNVGKRMFYSSWSKVKNVKTK